MAKNSNRRIKRSISFTVITALLALSPVEAQAQNVKPVAHAGLSRYAGPDPVVLDGTRSYDPDNSGPLHYTWQQINGPSVVIMDGNTATPTIAGSIQSDPGGDPTPRPQGFIQTDVIQECEFELVVSDGELASLPDSVKVIIVPDYGADVLTLQNESFDPDKPTILYFGGGDCTVGYTNPNYGPRLPFKSSEWTSRANIIWFPDGYGPDPDSGDRTYYRYGDMLIVYLSDVAPDYKERIQTSGWSTGGQSAIDVGIRLNLIYQDPRYAVNHVTLLDAAQYCRDYTNDIPTYLSSSVDGEQCFIDSHISTLAENYFLDPKPSFTLFHKNILNVVFDQYQNSSINWLQQHYLGNDWYGDSLFNPTALQFNQGIIGGAYWSVIGPGSNLQLSSINDTIIYQFKWYGNRSSGHMEFYDELNHPGRLPEPVTLLDPIEVADSNGFVLTCEESENAVSYELLFGADPYRVMDYDIISDTPTPPNHTITAIPSDKTWWTVRVHDQYGSTIYADPISMVAHNPNPANSAVYPDTWATLSWNEGIRVASYDVYFGENFIDVREGIPDVFRGNQTITYSIVGFAGFPYPDGLVPGTTYFWRIDDVGADSTVIHKGKIWRFTVSL